MVFSSITFLFYFLPITFFLVFAIRLFGNKLNLRPQNLILLNMSLLFYAWGEPVYIILMIGSILMNFLIGKAIGESNDDQRRKSFLYLAVILNLSALVVFKYAGMLVSFINLIIPYHDNFFHIPVIRLPIGISFFTFQALSYVVDVYRKEVPPQNKLINLALYISFFPQLIAGPIVRYHDINEQLEKRTIDKEGVYIGVIRFASGLIKKVLIANVVGEVADNIFAMDSGSLSTPLAWIGIISYTLQIYFDFSGYSDMAIGLARIFGFKLLENFNYPYIAKGIQDFWRRWHISLSTWFRDYLYIPLGGSRNGNFQTYLNQIIVFFLCGLWHGASWAFVVWGLYHGLFLTIEKLFLGRYLKKLPIALSHIYTIFIFMMGWVLFRAENFIDAIIYFKALFGMGASTNLEIWKYLTDYKLLFVILIGVLASTPIFKMLFERYSILSFPATLVKRKYIRFSQVIILSLILIGGVGYFSFPRPNHTDKTRITIESNAPSHQIFYAYQKMKYSEKNSVKSSGSSFLIPNINKLQTIRLDAILENGNKWQIKSIRIETDSANLNLEGDYLLKSITKKSKDLGNLILINKHEIEGNVLGHDPYFTLDLGYPLSHFNKLNERKDNTSKTNQWYISVLIAILLIFACMLWYIKNLRINVNDELVEIHFLKFIFNGLLFSIVVLALLFTIGSLAMNTYNPFIYFRF
jgi:alginate O-acetyltransferase complex protein AlgI